MKLPKVPKTTVRKKHANSKFPKQKKPKSVSKVTEPAAKQANPLPGTPAFLKLQAKWYKTLADEGFKDLEAVNNRTGDGLPILKGKSLWSFRTQDVDNTQHYFRRYSCFLVHNPQWTDSAVQRDIAKLHAEGESYRDIRAALQSKHKRGLSDWSIHEVIVYLDERVKRWNRISPKGLDFSPDIGE